MKELEERIISEGRVLPGNVLKVDSFLNHQVDQRLLTNIGKEFARLFADEGITKILTIEASGIAVAAFTSMAMDVPFVFAKKTGSLNLEGDLLTSSVMSYTYQKEYAIAVEAKFLSPADRVLIVDDFLANGMALKALLAIIRQSGAETAGIGICIEKAYQHGGDEIRRLGYHLESLAVIEAMSEEGITFRPRPEK